MINFNDRNPDAVESVALECMKKTGYDEDLYKAARRSLKNFIIPALHNYASVRELRMHGSLPPVDRETPVKTILIKSVSGKATVFRSDHEPLKC